MSSSEAQGASVLSSFASWYVLCSPKHFIRLLFLSFVQSENAANTVIVVVRNKGTSLYLHEVIQQKNNIHVFEADVVDSAALKVRTPSAICNWL